MIEHEHKPVMDYGKNIKALSLTFFLTLVIMFAEFFGGLISGSLALLSDAGHMLTDVIALSLSLLALTFSRRPATPEKTYGFYRFEILSALLNGSILIVIAFFIFYQAVIRFLSPREVQSMIMLVIAVIGLAANLVGAFILSKASRENLNIKGALWHVLSDALSSVGVIIGGLIIFFTKAYVVDSIVGFIIGILILRGAWELVSDSVSILLEATPKDIDLEKVVNEVKKIKGVRAVHDLHIWTITSGLRACSAHVLIDDILVSKCGEISTEVKDLLRDKFNLTHSTLQFECETCAEGLVCKLEK